MKEPIVQAEGLTKRFGPDAGVFDMDLELAPGLIVGFIGPSGSGKTTTVRLMTGIFEPDAGSILVLGIRPSEFDVTTRARLGYMPQEAILYPDLTLAENLDFAASLYGMPLRRQREVALLTEFLEFEGALDRFPRQASGGERRRLMLASTLVHQPDVLFLDEPTAGIDPVLRRKVWDRFRELAEKDRTLIVTTQYVGEAAYCDYVAVLAGGRILAFETPHDLRRRAYGGELMDITFARRPADRQIDALEGAVGARPVEWLDDLSLRVVVADTAQAGPEMARWGEQHDITLIETKTHVPSFDDVFVELVEKLNKDEERHVAS